MSAVVVWLLSKFGVKVAGWVVTLIEVGTLLAAVLGVWALVAGHYEGVGAARVQKTIDDPKTGWAARLQACKTAKAGAVSGVVTQNTGIEAKAKNDAESRGRAAADVASGAVQDRKQASLTAILDQPISHASTLPGSPTCLIPNEVAETLLEQDRRAQGR